MHQTQLMCVVKPLGGLRDVIGNAEEVEWSTVDDVKQVRAVNILRDEEVDSVVLVNVIGTNDVGMVATGEHPRFTVEPVEANGVFGEGDRQRLDGDNTRHSRVFAKETGSVCAQPNPLKHGVSAE